MPHTPEPAASPRPAHVTGNWKMHKTIEEACEYIKTLDALIKESKVTVYLAVPYTALYAVAKCVEGLGSPIIIGAQNMHPAVEGAFTGEIAARMLLNVGAKFVILGHIERRNIFKESDELINQKVKRALEEGIQPILCIGETLQQREAKKTEEVLTAQLLSSLEGVSSEQMSKLILTYEPVWLIGTGKVACPKDIDTVHAFIRKAVGQNWGQDVADRMVIQYGGWVKPENAADLLAQPNIDGLLVGSAALSADTFSKIINFSEAGSFVCQQFWET